MKSANELTNRLNISYINEYGETLTLKVDEDLNLWFNHNDIHQDGEFEPWENRLQYVFNNSEVSVMMGFEIIVTQLVNYKSELN
jgi:hypothetical protein